MVLSFSENPLDDASASSHAFSESGADPPTVGDDSSVNDANSTGDDSGTAPTDETSVKVVARNPNFFDDPETDFRATHTQAPVPEASTTIPASRGQQQSRPLPPLARPLSKRSDSFDLPFPLNPSSETSFLKLPLADWSDSFVTDFHFRLTSSPGAWDSFTTSFAKTLDPSLLQKFLDCDLKNHATAFLGIDRRGDLLLIHNLRLSPGSGTLLDPVPHFLCLTRSPFRNNPPSLLDSDDMPSILAVSSFPNIPSVQEILDACLSASSDRDLPPFAMNVQAWKDFKTPPASLATASATSRTFSSSSLFPIPPNLATHLIQFFEKHRDRKYRTPATVAKFIFSVAAKIWSKSLPAIKSRPPKKFPVTLECILPPLQTLRFLWAIEHGILKPSPLFLEVPSDPDSASSCFDDLIKSSFHGLLPAHFNPITPPTKPRSPPKGPTPMPHGPNPFAPPIQTQHTSSRQFSSQLPPGVSPDMVFLTEKVSAAISQQSSVLKAHEDRKDHFKTLPIHTINSLIFGQVGPHSTCLPTNPSAMAVEIFKQKNTYAFYQTIHAQIFRRSDNNCYILFGQCGILQKFGPRWKAEEQPSGFSPLSFDPYNSAGASDPRAIDHDIYEDLFECEMRQANGISTKDMREIFRNHRLFYPVTGEEFHLQLRSYYLFAAAIWGKDSHIAGQTSKIIDHYLKNRKTYMNNQIDDSTFLCKVLFSVDHAVQHFIESQLEEVSCLEDIQVTRLDYQMNKLIDKIMSREDICRMPRAILVEVQSKVRENDVRFHPKPTNNNSKKAGVKRSATSQADEKEPQATRARFESPTDWKLPTDLKYSKAFPKMTLANMPTVTIDGKTRPFCNKLFSLQLCRNGPRCFFSHANPADHGKEDEMSQFYNTAYTTAKNL